MLPLAMQAQGKRYYVTKEAETVQAQGDGLSWSTAMTLKQAIGTAKAGDEIWVKGYEAAGGGNSYVVPEGGYTLESGVSLYGGFSGEDGNTIDNREVIDKKAYRMKYRTVITGDIDRNDIVKDASLIFPGNATRGNNARHVLTLNLEPTPQSGNNNTLPTVVNGVTIARGHYHGDGGVGAGIYVTGDNSRGGIYRIERCFFIENYANQGGALYVSNTVKNVNGQECLIDRCGFFNNAAGERAVAENHGGAVWLAGAGTIVNTAIFNNENGGVCLENSAARVVNSTITRNTGSGADGSEAYVYNTVIWGNSLLTSTDKTRPGFDHCAYPEANAEGEPANGNVYLAAKNNEDRGPHFSSPSLKTGFDTDYDILHSLYPLWTWEPMEATPLVDAGNDGAYAAGTYGSVDLNGDRRQQGTIDIGAFEYQPVAAGRIRYVKQGGTGDGTSWTNASGDIQRMIDDLADNNPGGQPGEVWIAAGEYEPQTQLISNASYSASFRMRDGISVYGGFAGGEASKTARTMKTKPEGEEVMPWEFEHTTVLKAAYYDRKNLTLNGNKWTLTSDSRHVVWFAPMQDEDPFTQVTTLDGVTIMGGYAQGGTGLDDFYTDRGAGVYMDGENAYLTNCTVTENNATGNGGGVYLRNGRVQSSLIYNNNSDQNGGGVYVDDQGLVHRSMLANNSARNGAGVYLDNSDEAQLLPEYLILSTCVVSNNTASGNGAVYCNQGGVLLQNTIVNNKCVTATDLTDPNASQTGGVYINYYALVINSVLWNNIMQSTGTNIPMYAKNPAANRVRFLYNAMSGVNNAVWNDIRQEQTLSLVDENKGGENTIGPRFEEPAQGSEFGSTTLESAVGILALLGSSDNFQARTVSYFWKPINGSNLWARGMALGQLPTEVVLAPEIDIAGGLFAQKPAVGAFHVERSQIVPALEDGNTLVVYVDAACTEPEHHGSSWATAYRSLNDAIAFFAGLATGSETFTGNGTEQSDDDYGRHTVDASTKFEIRVLEGNLWPRYAFVNEDPKTATLDILAMPGDRQLRIVGGYPEEIKTDAAAQRDPLNHRSQLNGNTGGSTLEDGLYHVVTVEPGARVVLDGFHIINGYAAGTATLQYGAGMFVRQGATVTAANCIFENNTAATGAAIYAADAASLTLQNCVVNNNTNTDTSAQVIQTAQDESLTMQHVTVVNNVGAAPENNSLYATSFSAGNVNAPENGTTGGMNNTLTLATIGETGAKNFANPTNKAGATLGFDTYLGGYSSFRPLTSSAEAGNNIINQASGTDVTSIPTDITAINDRDLGGVPDLGAYEADLPKAGEVIYVTPTGSGTKDGSSWNNAIAGNTVYDVESSSITNIPTSDTRYAGFYDVNSRPYGEKSNASKLFFDYLDEDDMSQANVTYSTRTIDGVTHITSITGIDIKNERKEQYVSGLQYAVEKAAVKAAQTGKNAQVWVAGGTYTDWKGFVIRDRVDVLGGFPNEGKPGADDRHPLLSGYIPANKRDASLDKTKYETIIQVSSEKPYIENNDGSYSANNLPGRVRKHVLFQPDVCLPTLSPSGRESYSHVWSVNGGFWPWGNESWDALEEMTNSINVDDNLSNTYRYNRPSGNQNGKYVEYNGATWDGFTIRHGYLTSYSANRDGGAGVRMFRGVTLRNCVVADNYINYYGGRNTGSAGMGAGIYSDGSNSYIINCFVLNNVNNNPNSSGGGANLMVGTSYNSVFANNYSEKDGGGVFLENAHFYNNTVAYNTIGWGNGGGIRQWTRDRGDGLEQEMLLFNTILYGNNKDAIYSEKFTEGSNCYIQTAQNLSNNLASKFTDTQIGQNLSSPFASANAQTENNYRLSTNAAYCINKGTEEYSLPETDVDFTARIKDCAVDIGAYELDNRANTVPQTVGNQRIYYVTQNGAGTANAGSLDNAACAEKLQIVLDAAGEQKKNNPSAEVVVKVAGYEDFVYHANTLANVNDPMSYSYTVPYGVVLEGGYSDQDNNWNDDGSRNAMERPTKLSAVYEGTATTQAVNGYHAVTFGKKPEEWTGTGENADAQNVIDGVWLVDGSATSMAGGGDDTRGGGAIVPAWGHVRNCVVTGNAAVDGGGLYLMPGATVSGTLVYGNTATGNGAGIYAENDGAGDDNRAHIISCTIAGNEAADGGGGLYLEDGASMQVNTVVWGNTAPTGNNVSGVTGQPFADTRLASVYNITGKTQFYPFNNCFIESMELPSDFINTSMQSDADVYFADVDDTHSDYRLKELSPLIKHGMDDKYFDGFVSEFNIAESDMRGTLRNENIGKLDAGAFAYSGGILPDKLFTRIFVSQGTNVKLRDKEKMLDYLGRSFYTSFPTLEDALAYIRKMRKDRIDGADDDTHFEILVAHGTYKPTNMRTDAASGVAYDQRLYSFVVPQNVSIYGGFTGEEKYVTPIDMQYGDNKVSSIPAEGYTDINDVTTTLEAMLSVRGFSDFNGNGIEEPWELEQQTILSGAINASATARNVYHVLLTNDTDATHGVVLDGLTVMDGETYHEMSNASEQNEAGRGGGLYSNGVGYTISRCRFLNNFGVRGGAVFMRDARLNVIGSMFAGNGTVDNYTTAQYQTPRGGAIFLSGVSSEKSDAALFAVNSLFVNNETAGEGGAIGTNYAEGITGAYDPSINLMNCTFVRNKANTNPVIYNHNGKNIITNTLIWGNEGKTAQETSVAHDNVTYSASDENYYGLFGDADATPGSVNTNYNILLSKTNNDTFGPRFTSPSTTAGVAGNSSTNLWNPAAISVVTDKGDGLNPDDNNNTEDAYTKWFTELNTGLTDYAKTYMNGSYDRYSGPLNYDENGNQIIKRTIDIGVYEYQYESNFQNMVAIYVATEEAGRKDGSDWANATSDLRGAIVGASNPKQNDGDRTIYVRDGVYELDRLSGGTAFTANITDNASITWNGLTIKGSCTGVGLGDEAQQDFSNQSVIRKFEGVATPQLMSVRANGDKYLCIEGFTFINVGGTGIDASTTSQGGKFILANSALRQNQTGVDITGNSGSVLIYNTLFADGGTGLNVQSGADNVTLVNTTFANNSVADMNTGLSNVYNSVSWNNTAHNMQETEGQSNKVFTFTGEAADNNADIQNGPNFVDPLNADVSLRDYHIRPSLTLLNKGNNALYAQHVLNGGDASLANEKDLGNNARVTDTSIDIGAYEYEAPLQPIVYVRAGLSIQNPDGKSWDTALGDLQGAADLASIYAHDDEKKTGYVFVDRSVKDADLRITLPRTKVYGGMNRETSGVDYDENGTIDNNKVEQVVADLLNERDGLIERTSTYRSTLRDVTVNAEGSVVDGFEVNGSAAVNNGYLSTSVVNGNVTGADGGILYNSLVYGNVRDVKAVNVTATASADGTATGTIAEATGNANNRAGVTETNTYVTSDDWKYQLMETSEDIGGGGDNEQATRDCQTMVGHECDIAGNKRIRDGVDNGCFETWNITADASVTDTDYPHGQSVVYVRAGSDDAEGAELTVKKKYTENSPFNPGVLLLEHRAGLRVEGNGEGDGDTYGDDGNNVGLPYVIVERNVPEGKVDMAYVPFNATIQKNGDGVKLQRYNARERADYEYTFNKDNGAWADFTDTDTYDGSYGLLLDNTAGKAATVRFVGKGDSRQDYVYREGKGITDAAKTVRLKKENHSEPWATPQSGGNKFTHKENMSWNLFGSPYLCAMNYDDMEYGRVIYGYQNDNYDNYDNYVTVNTDVETTPAGHIPAGDAVFTQTATLKDYETFGVSPRGDEKSGVAYENMAEVKLSVARTGETRSADGGAAQADVLQLGAVEPGMARTDFDMGADGVKWMADGVAQIYAVQGGGRYSLLSAVNVEGKVAVGVSVPEAGMYTIAVPDDCLADGYETVVLEDNVAHKTVDLLEGGYDFTTAVPGDIEGRFAVSFNRMVDDGCNDGIRAYSAQPGMVRVEGVEAGDRISVYSADGIMVAQRVAASSAEDIAASVAAVAVVKVERDGKTVKTVKLKIKN